MKAVQEVSPVPVRFDEISSGAKGYYSNTEKEIVIQNGMSESQTMKTGIHEVTHAMCMTGILWKNRERKRTR